MRVAASRGSRAQVRLRNIFDVAFDEMERATQRERYERLRQIYPAAVNRHFLMRWMNKEQGAPVSGRRMERYERAVRTLKFERTSRTATGHRVTLIYQAALCLF